MAYVATISENNNPYRIELYESITGSFYMETYLNGSLSPVTIMCESATRSGAITEAHNHYKTIGTLNG